MLQGILYTNWSITSSTLGRGSHPFGECKEFVDYVKTHIERATWVMTVCTGAEILARTGLVDGYNMT